MSAFIVQGGQTLLFVGDSITDCGRRAAEAPFGNGYARMVYELALSRYPARQIRVVNKGIGGNRITDLQARWADDVLYHEPHPATAAARASAAWFSSSSPATCRRCGR